VSSEPPATLNVGRERVSKSSVLVVGEVLFLEPQRSIRFCIYDVSFSARMQAENPENY
jgi:hypothetical protein